MALTETRLDKIIGVGSGTGSRPAAGQSGARWIDTTGPTESYDDGSTWHDLAGGGGSGDWVKIATVTASGAVASLSFTSIPGTYAHLALVGMLRASDSAARHLCVQFNADTGTNYGDEYAGAQNTTGLAHADAGIALPTLGQIADGTGTANFGSPAFLLIPRYADTNWIKQLLAQVGRIENTGGTGYTASQSTGMWNSTAAITRVDILASAGNLADKSSFTLYGLNG